LDGLGGGAVTIGKAIRWLLVFAAAILVAWSFVEVGLRLWRQYDPTDHRIRLTVLHWGDPEEDQIVRTMVEEYEKTHPNVKIVRINAADYDAKLNTMLAADTPPDLFYLKFQFMPEFSEYHLLADLGPYVDRLPEGKQWLNGFYPSLLDAFRYDGQRSGVGPLYGIPKDFTTCVMYVNCDLFEQAGIQIPYNGWSWEEFEADCRKITDLTNKDHPTGPIYGAVLNSWPWVLQNILECYGGDIFDGEDFRHVRLTEPASVQALDMIQRMKFTEHTVFEATGPDKDNAGSNLFFTGKIGCIGPFGRWATARYRGTGPGDPGITAFKWDVVPMPHEKYNVSAIACIAWAMSASCKHPDEAFDLLHVLTNADGQREVAKLGLAIPSMKAVAESPDFLDGKPDHSQLFLDALKYSRINQIPPDREFERYMNDDMDEALTLNNVPAAVAAQNFKDHWLSELQSPLRKGKYPLMNWTMVAIGTVAVMLVATLITMSLTGRRKLGSLDRKAERVAWLFISPWFIGFLALALGPMIMSLLLSFTRWTAMAPITEARFVGWGNYTQLFTFDHDFAPSLRVTAYYVILIVPLGQIAALAVAMLMNANVKGIGLFRTIYYLPTLVGAVAMATIWLTLYNVDYGLIDHLLAPICRFFHTTPPDWVGQDASRWGVIAFVIMSLWTVGGGMLTYLAALKNVPISLYEAARIDGSSSINQFFAITLPMISPLIFFNLIMAIIASFQIFVQVIVMTDGGPGNATLFYVLYLFRQAFQFHNMGYASAMAWVLFVLVLALTGIVMRSGRSWVYYEGLKQ
jgi:multiple sugar transport system permease protein